MDTLQCVLTNEYYRHKSKSAFPLPDNKLFVILEDKHGDGLDIFQVWDLITVTMIFKMGDFLYIKKQDRKGLPGFDEFGSHIDKPEDYYIDTLALLPNNELLLTGYSKFYIYNMDSDSIKILSNKNMCPGITQFFVLPNSYILVVSYNYTLFQIYG